MYSHISRYVLCVLVATMLLIGRTDLSRCYAATSQARIYWSDNISTWRVNADGSEITQIFSHPVSDMFIDSRTNSLYSTGSGGVYRSSLDGGDYTKIFSLPGDGSPLSIAFDNVRNRIYFVDHYISTIYRIDLDGSNPTVIIPTDGMTSAFIRIEDVRVDPIAEKLYWSYRKRAFYRSNLDGSEVEGFFDPADWPLQDFEIDPINGKIYWTSAGGGPNRGLVRRANIDGTGAETLVSDGLWGAYGIALDVARDKIYFSDAWIANSPTYDGTIQAANLDGSMVSTIIDLGPVSIAQPWHGLAIDTQAVPEPCTSVLGAIATCCCLAFVRRRR